MEYADGGDLNSLIDSYRKRKSLFSEKKVLTMFSQIVKALRVIHQMGILHRDLKSANIFLTKDNEVKIGDFNVAKLAQKGLLATQTGTPYYMCPEIWKEIPYNSKSDIWSIGVILYEMCTLHLPFLANNIHALYLKIMEGKHAPLPQCYSKELNNLIKMCLNSDPKKRPSACQLIFMIPHSKTNNEGLSRCITQVLKKTIKVNSDCSIIEKSLPRPHYYSAIKSIRYSRRMNMNSGRSNKSQQDMRDISHPLSCERAQDRASSRFESPFPLKPVRHIIKKIHKFSNASDISLNDNSNFALNSDSKQNDTKRLKIYLNCIPGIKYRSIESRDSKTNHSSTPSSKPLPPINVGVSSSRSNDRYVENFLTPLLRLKRNIKLIRGDGL